MENESHAVLIYLGRAIQLVGRDAKYGSSIKVIKSYSTSVKRDPDFVIQIVFYLTD